jgi:hypothetical protein
MKNKQINKILTYIHQILACIDSDLLVIMSQLIDQKRYLIQVFRVRVRPFYLKEKKRK